MIRCSLLPEIPLADSGSLTTGTSVDSQAGFEIGRLPKPTWRICTHLSPLVRSKLSPLFRFASQDHRLFHDN
jgi:proteasome activator subunit 4